MGGPGSGWFASAGHVSHKPKYAIGRQAAEEYVGETYLGRDIRKQPEKLPGAYKYKPPAGKKTRPPKNPIKKYYKDVPGAKDDNDAVTRLKTYLNPAFANTPDCQKQLQAICDLPDIQRDELLRGMAILDGTGVTINGIVIAPPPNSPDSMGMYRGHENEIYIHPNTVTETGPRPGAAQRLELKRQEAIASVEGNPGLTRERKDEMIKIFKSIKRNNVGDDKNFLAACIAHENNHAKHAVKAKDPWKCMTAMMRTMRKHKVTDADCAQVSAYTFTSFGAGDAREVYAEVGAALFTGETYVPQSLINAYYDRKWYL